MQTKLCLIVLLMSTVAYSQSPGQMRYYEYNVAAGKILEPIFFEENLDVKVLASLHVEKAQITSVYKKNKPNVRTITLNEFGNISTVETNKSSIKYNYRLDTILAEVKSVVKKTETITRYKYNEEFNLVGEEKMKNGKAFSIRSVELKNDKIVNHTFSWGRNLKKTAVLAKVYDTEGKLVSSTFSINGKIKNEWDYTCKPEGSDLVASKSNDMASMCTFREEHANGSYKVFTRTIEKGKSHLFVIEYDQDSTFIRQDKFENDSILISSTVLEGNTTMYSNYKKEKLTSCYLNEHNESKQVVRREFYNGKNRKLSAKYEYEYNDQGLVEKKKSSFSKKQVSVTDYEYTYFD